MEKKGVTGFTLKMIAVITMCIDHFAATVLLDGLFRTNPTPAFFADHFQMWYVIYEILRGIGRMAFPIYCFLLVEGFQYTKSRLKYALRLFAFAVISEVPFDRAFNQSWFDWTSNNVFWTLLVGLFAIWLIELIQTKIKTKKEKKDEKRSVGMTILRVFLILVVSVSTMALAQYVLSTDYGGAGVAIIIVMYLLRFNRMISFAAGVVVLTALTFAYCGPIEFLAMFMLIPISQYNGERGRKVNKYVFYAFYPVHIAVWAGLSYLLWVVL